MANGTVLALVCVTIVATFAFPHPEAEVISQPKPGDEYVFVHATGSGARPVARKDKPTSDERPFETSHKFPSSLTYTVHDSDDDTKNEGKSKLRKREATPAEGPAPAPAGAIKLDVSKLLERYKSELKSSTKVPNKQAPSTTKSPSKRGTHKRTKKEATEERVVATSPRPVLTTGAAVPRQVDDDVPLVASGSEKQRSRIQIKKAPNGQEYEYEYVYYYYDEDDDQKVTNSHDGPARNQVSNKNKSTVERTSAAPEVNEVLPSSRGRTRGRQLGEEEVGEERLPANTRFPPRSRNLNTTPLPEEEAKSTRGRGRGRPTTEAAPNAATEADSISDETQGSRGRTRANVRRPSLELVDNASFNTHSNTAGAEPSAGSPAFPTDLPAGPELIRKFDNAPEAKREESVTESAEENVTTVMSPMDKVALDLYAILQGTQKLSGEDTDLGSEENATTNLNDGELTTVVETTTELTVEITTPTTTTTTTTTTTPAPTTTTTTTDSFIGRGRFKGRGRKTTHSTTTTEAAHTETKPKSKFSRPSFGGRHRLGTRTTSESPTEQEAAKEEAKPVSHAKPTLSRSRFGASRTRTRTTASPSESHEESSSTAAPSSRPSLTRPRTSFNLRTRGRSTTPASEGDLHDAESSTSSEAVSSTPRTRKIQPGSGVRPLRPGPRINLGRGRPGQTTTTTEEPAEDHVTGDEDQPSKKSSDTSEEPETSSAAVDNSPLGRLKNKQRVNVQARPKAAASTPVQVRRVNPLLARRRPGQTTEASSSEAPQESASTEAAAEEADNQETEAPAATSSTTTEEPRGLNKLLAGRRRLATRPATHH